MSKLIKAQSKTITKNNVTYKKLEINIRYDDSCGNGHNTFSITGSFFKNVRETMGGCCHDEIAEAVPELAHLIKWHLCSSTGPMHYIANTTYHMSQGNLEYARSSAIGPYLTPAQLSDEEFLNNRLPMLLNDFTTEMEALGFTY